MRVIAVSAAPLVLAGAVLAHSGATGVVKERMDAMSSMADSMKVIVPMMRGQTTYESAAFAQAAQDISDQAGQSLVDMFPAGSLMAPSEASEVIWSDFDRFAGLALTLEDQAEALALAALASDSPPTAEFGEMARTCGACHQDFRIEQE